MRRLIIFIRSLFCEHEWEDLGEHKHGCFDSSSVIIRLYRCKKCGYVQRIKY